MIKHFANRNKNETIGPHSIRYMIIKDLLKKNPIEKVKNIIGHKSIKTTEIYANNIENNKKNTETEKKTTKKPKKSKKIKIKN